MEQTEIPTPRHSETVQLVMDIETLTKATWNQELRHEVAELIRKYRFNQVGSAMLRVQALVRESGNVALSEKVFMGRF